MTQTRKGTDMRMMIVVIALVLSGCAHTPGVSSVKLAPAVAGNLEFFYRHMDSEFAFCAYGAVHHGELNITNLALPELTRANASELHYWTRTCPRKNLLGFIHSHPKYCEFSWEDINSFLEYEKLSYDFLFCPGAKVIWNDRTTALADYGLDEEAKHKGG